MGGLFFLFSWIQLPEGAVVADFRRVDLSCKVLGLGTDSACKFNTTVRALTKSTNTMPPRSMEEYRVVAGSVPTRQKGRRASNAERPRMEAMPVQDVQDPNNVGVQWA